MIFVIRAKRKAYRQGLSLLNCHPGQAQSIQTGFITFELSSRPSAKRAEPGSILKDLGSALSSTGLDKGDKFD